MARYGKVGAFRQVAHPRIRGALASSKEQKQYTKVVNIEDYKTDEETYFVPSFSIRRHLHRSEEQPWEEHRHSIARRLGRGFRTIAVGDIALKSIEQHRFIKNMRQAGIHPEPEEIRDLACSIRDGLNNMLADQQLPLSVPLGNFNQFGYRKNALAYEIGGWRGDRANYDDAGNPANYSDINAVLLKEQQLEVGVIPRTAHGVILHERQFVVGAIALAYQDSGLSLEGLAPNPHLTIARSHEEIPDYSLRGLNSKLADLAMEDVLLGDPVIQMKLYRDQPAELLYVKHAWDSLAPEMPQPPVSSAAFELDYDRYESMASHVRYA